MRVSAWWFKILSQICCVFQPAKMMKKVPFQSCVGEAHVRRMKKNEDKIVYFFLHFIMLSIDFNHANACASMHSLVEIPNRDSLKTCFFSIREKPSLTGINPP